MRAWMLALAGCAIILDLAVPTLTSSAGSGPETGVQTLEGYVCAPAARDSSDRLAFLFCPYDAARSGLLRSGAIRVTTDAGLSRHELAGALRLELELRPPVAPLNQGGGGYERWLYQERILATARLREHDPLPGQCGLRCRYHQWRISLIQHLDQHLSRMRHPELAEALLLGSRARLDERHWEVFEATGTQHLVAISGLHLGLVALFIGQLVRYPARRLSPRYPRFGRWLPLAVTLVAGLGYALVAGFTVPTQRALVMVGVAGVLASGGRQWRLWDGWLFAAVLVVILEPRAILGMGFWFSFGAVACLIAALGARQGPPGLAPSMLVAQIAVVAGLMPIMMGFGIQPSLLALPANLIAIPLLSLVVMPLLLIAAPLVLLSPTTAGWVEPGLDLVFRLLWRVLETLAEFEWSMPGMDGGLVLVLAGAIMVALWPVGWPCRATVGAAAALMLAFPPGGDDTPGPVSELRFPDGFGGPMALFRHQGRSVLFDARSPDAGYRGRTRDRVLPWLESLGVDRLDAVVLSHPEARAERHWNFSGGPRISRMIEADGCGRVDKLGFEGAGLRPWRDPRGGALPRVEQACNLILRAGRFDAVLFGPIRRSGERRLLRSLDAPADTDLVLAPRGGARGSSQLGLLEVLRPRWAVLTPATWSPGAVPPASERYRKVEAEPLATPVTGEVTVSLTPDGPRVEKARETGPWHSTP